MGGHKGRNRKRRAGRIGAVTQKTSGYSKYKPPQIRDNKVRAAWDPKQTARMNMANMGLASTVNQKVSGRGLGITVREGLAVEQAADSNVEEGSRSKTAAVVVELFDIPESDDVEHGTVVIKGRTRANVMLPLSVEDQEYMSRCLEKHGTDYEAMNRDIKLNDMQHTAGKLRKMGARFLLLEEGQRRAEVPENMKDLVVGKK